MLFCFSKGSSFPFFFAERPFSESDIDRPGPAPQPQQCRRSASSSPPALTIDSNLEDDVFVSPRTANGNDLFSSRNLEIFGYGSPRTPAGVLLNGRSERSFTFSVSSQKQSRDKGGTDHADGAHTSYTDDDDVSIFITHFQFKVRVLFKVCGYACHGLGNKQQYSLKKILPVCRVTASILAGKHTYECRSNKTCTLQIYFYNTIRKY